MTQSVVTKIEPFGELKYNSDEKQWFGIVKNISPANEIELALEVEKIDQDLNEKFEIIRGFVKDIDSITSALFEFVRKNYFLNSNKTIDEIKQMYFLTAITLKNDNKSWWLVLEPSFNVETPYNHFLRFTFANGKLVWSNIEQILND